MADGKLERSSYRLPAVLLNHVNAGSQLMLEHTPFGYHARITFAGGRYLFTASTEPLEALDELAWAVIGWDRRGS